MSVMLAITAAALLILLWLMYRVMFVEEDVHHGLV
jgi:hypothetical protein